MIGVSFQPGQNGQQNGQAGSQPTGGGVQEAIKVLSLRLPKVLGAQAAVPMPLLTSQGSGGNPRVDSIVQQILARIMPQGPAMPMQPAGMPSFGNKPQQQAPLPSPWSTPNIVIGNPPTYGTDANLGGNTPPGMIAGPPPQMPNFNQPTPPPNWGQIGSLLGGSYGGSQPEKEPQYF